MSQYVNLRTGEMITTRREFGKGLAAIISAGVAPSIALGLAGSANASGGRGMMRSVGARNAAMFGGESLPHEPLEYLESNGNQYIDLGIAKFKKIECEFYPKYITGGDERNYVFAITPSGGAGRIQFAYINGFCGWSSDYGVVSFEKSISWHHIVMDNGRFTLDGSVIADFSSVPWIDGYSPRTAIIFGNCAEWILSYQLGSHRIRKCTITKFDNSKIDFRPALKDGIPAMYDFETGIYFYNATINHQFGYKDMKGNPPVQPY